jgi:RES domain
VRLNPKVLADLAVDFRPTKYLRVTSMANVATPLGTGYSPSRFSSATKAFKVLYIACDVETALAETIVRDRFEGKAKRLLAEEEMELWGATEVSAVAPLKVMDLRTKGAVLLGVSTDAVRGKAQRSGRALSQAIHRTTDADGILYFSRLTVAPCVAVFDRAAAKLTATPVVGLLTLASVEPALKALEVTLIRR